MTGHGYVHWAAHLRGELTLEAAIAATAKDVRAYSRRQMTWLRRDPEIRAGDPTAGDPPGLPPPVAPAGSRRPLAAGRAAASSAGRARSRAARAAGRAR